MRAKGGKKCERKNKRRASRCWQQRRDWILASNGRSGAQNSVPTDSLASYGSRYNSLPFFVFCFSRFASPHLAPHVSLCFLWILDIHLLFLSLPFPSFPFSFLFLFQFFFSLFFFMLDNRIILLSVKVSSMSFFFGKLPTGNVIPIFQIFVNRYTSDGDCLKRKCFPIEKYEIRARILISLFRFERLIRNGKDQFLFERGVTPRSNAIINRCSGSARNTNRCKTAVVCSIHSVLFK